MQSLPREIISFIISYVGPNNRARLREIDREFDQLISRDSVWKDVTRDKK